MADDRTHGRGLRIAPAPPPPPEQRGASSRRGARGRLPPLAELSGGGRWERPALLYLNKYKEKKKRKKKDAIKITRGRTRRSRRAGRTEPDGQRGRKSRAGGARPPPPPRVLPGRGMGGEEKPLSGAGTRGAGRGEIVGWEGSGRAGPGPRGLPATGGAWSRAATAAPSPRSPGGAVGSSPASV